MSHSTICATLHQKLRTPAEFIDFGIYFEIAIQVQALGCLLVKIFEIFGIES